VQGGFEREIDGTTGSEIATTGRDIDRSAFQSGLSRFEAAHDLINGESTVVKRKCVVTTARADASEVGLKGDTQSGANKPATTTTGLTLNVPLFVSTGDRIVVNSTTGEYTGRAD